MSKRSGFAVKITAFIEADPKDMAVMTIAMEKIGLIVSELEQEGFVCIEHDARFMLSRAIPDDTAAGNGAAPDEPKAAEAVAVGGKITLVEDLNFPPAYESVSKTADGKYTHGREMPPIPAHLDARNRRT